jgi:ABC-2 type transport system ATP-binding protein
VNIISTHSLCRRYGHRVGIDGVDLEVPAGQIFGFLGPNGAGKTTTIRILLGLLRPTRGSASIKGLDCWRQSPRVKREVGYLPGDVRLYPWLTVNSALKLSGRVRKSNLRPFGEELSSRLQLEMTLRVRKMSRGMRQKLGLILALAHRPPLIVLDEPTSGLDPLIQEELATILREMAANGHTIFFSSHTLSEVELLCDQIAIVRAGRIVADESLASLRERARRSVRLVFNSIDEARDVGVPEFLSVIDRSGRQWLCELSGTAPRLASWAATQPLEDMIIGPPDLETLFRRYYHADAEVE